MIKYNYNKAGRIWSEMIDITYDMPDYLDYTGRQCERRIFLRALTRNDSELKNVYIDYITDYLAEFSGTKFLTTEDGKKLEKIALQIVLFTNDDNF